jgi:hypothetical protein
MALAAFSVPAGLCFWAGIRIAYAEMGVIWGPRFLIFGLSYVTFPILTWHFMHESMFTPKTLICTALAFMIIGIQLFWR